MSNIENRRKPPPVPKFNPQNDLKPQPTVDAAQDGATSTSASNAAVNKVSPIPMQGLFLHQRQAAQPPQQGQHQTHHRRQQAPGVRPQSPQ